MRIITLLTTMLVMLAFSPVAISVDFSLGWTPPTERMDGSPLDPVTEISQYDLQCYVSGGPGDIVVTETIPGQTKVGEFETNMGDLFPRYGSYACELRAVDNAGRASDWVLAEGGPIVYQPQPPRAPTSVLIMRND